MSGSTHPFRAVLFDFDGTLGNSYPSITASVNHVRSLHGLAALAEEDVRRHVGRGALFLIEHTVPRGDLHANVEAYRTHQPTVYRSGTSLLPGAHELLASLHGHGLQLGVCSNKPLPFTRELLSFFEVDRYLEAILGPEDVARPKPAPDMLLAALQRLGARADESLYIGDMVIDIQTARSACVRVWVIPTGSEEVEDLRRGQPDHLLSSLAEVPGLLGLEATMGR